MKWKRESENERGSPWKKWVGRGRGKPEGGCGQSKQGPNLSGEI